MIFLKKNSKLELQFVRVWLQRPNDTTPETERASSMSIAEATAPGVVGAYKNPVNSRGGYFPREDFPAWPVSVQKIPSIPVVTSSRGKGSRGGQFPSKNTREFP